MKIILIISVFFCIIISCKTKAEGKFQFNIDGSSKSVDTIIAGENKSYEIFIENKTKNEAIVLDISKSCDCADISLKNGEKINTNSLKKYSILIHTDKTHSNKKIDFSISIRTNLEPSIYSITKTIFIK